MFHFFKDLKIQFSPLKNSFSLEFDLCADFQKISVVCRSKKNLDMTHNNDEHAAAMTLEQYYGEKEKKRHEIKNWRALAFFSKRQRLNHVILQLWESSSSSSTPSQVESKSGGEREQETFKVCFLEYENLNTETEQDIMLYLKKVFYLVGGYLKIRTFNDFAKNIKNALLHLESHSCCVRSVFRKFVKPELNVVDFHLTVGVLFFVIDLLKRRSQDFLIPRSNFHQISKIQTDFDF